MVKNRNAYYQKQVADQVLNQAEERTSLLTDALNVHLNIGQNFTISSSSIFFTLGKVSLESLTNRLFPQVGSGRVMMPSSLRSNQTSNDPVTFRVGSPSVMKEPSVNVSYLSF